jgi:hypothetical protein
MIYTIVYSDFKVPVNKYFACDDYARQYGRNHPDIKEIRYDGQIVYEAQEKEKTRTHDKH